MHRHDTNVEKLLREQDAMGVAEAVRAGEVTATELVDAAIARAQRLNPSLGFLVAERFDAARAEARRVRPDAPFAGAPFLVKDLLLAFEGLPATGGSRIPPAPADHDSDLTKRFKAAGLIILGRTASPEFGLKQVTESAAHGAARNPFDTERTPGGSSGGSAAAVAAGVAPAAHATDGGGSIRIPAACCGLVGLKTSRGRVPATPDDASSWGGLAVSFVVTKSIRDAAAFLDLVAGPSPISLDASRDVGEGSFSEAARREPKGLTLGLYRSSPLGLEVDEEVEKALGAAGALAREAGHQVEEIGLPFDGRTFTEDYVRVVAGYAAATIRAQSERIGRNALGYVERTTRLVARYGEALSGGEVLAARERLDHCAMALIAATLRFDAVLTPIIARPPIKIGAFGAQGVDAVAEDLLDRLRLSRPLRLPQVMRRMIDQRFGFTPWPQIQNVTGQPAIALPVHRTPQGLPVGVQAVGRPGDERGLLALAGQLERIGGWRERPWPALGAA